MSLKFENNFVTSLSFPSELKKKQKNSDYKFFDIKSEPLSLQVHEYDLIRTFLKGYLLLFTIYNLDEYQLTIQ